MQTPYKNKYLPFNGECLIDNIPLNHKLSCRKSYVLDTLERMNSLTHFLKNFQESCCPRKWDRAIALGHDQKRCEGRGTPETNDLSQCHPCSHWLLIKAVPLPLLCPLHRSVGLKPFMSRQPTRLLMQSFSTYPARETGFQWSPSVGYCYPFRGKFPVQGSIVIPINDDIIHAARICMPPAKTFPCRGCSPYLFRNPSLQVGNVFALYRSMTHGNSLPHCASESFKTPGDFYVHL